MPCSNPTCRHRQKRKLRPLVISIILPNSASSDDDSSSPPTPNNGISCRHEQITRMFKTHPSLSAHFEAPIFSPGVPSREIRNRLKLLEYANQAGLIPKIEWELICKALNEQLSPSAINNANGEDDEKKTDQEVLRLSKLELSQEQTPGETQAVIDPFIYLATTSRIIEEPPTISSNNCNEDTKTIATDTASNNKQQQKKKMGKKHEFETK